MLVSNIYSLGVKCFMYFIGYLYVDDAIKPLFRLFKLSGSIGGFWKVKDLSFILHENHEDKKKTFRNME